jgi:two-component sensor histidine kinase
MRWAFRASYPVLTRPFSISLKSAAFVYAKTVKRGQQRGFEIGELTEKSGSQRQVPPNLAMNSFPGPCGQVLTNLFLNSVAHAFSDGKGGIVDIKVQAAGKDESENSLFGRRLPHGPRCQTQSLRSVFSRPAGIKAILVSACT